MQAGDLKLVPDQLARVMICRSPAKENQRRGTLERDEEQGARYRVQGALERRDK